LIADPELFGNADVVVSLGPMISVRVDPDAYLSALGGEAVECIGRTRLLPGGGAVDSPPTRL
jgi:hypothetical protein